MTMETVRGFGVPVPLESKWSESVSALRKQTSAPPKKKKKNPKKKTPKKSKNPVPGQAPKVNVPAKLPQKLRKSDLPWN